MKPRPVGEHDGLGAVPQRVVQQQRVVPLDGQLGGPHRRRDDQRSDHAGALGRARTAPTRPPARAGDASGAPRRVAEGGRVGMPPAPREGPLQYRRCEDAPHGDGVDRHASCRGRHGRSSSGGCWCARPPSPRSAAPLLAARAADATDRLHGVRGAAAGPGRRGGRRPARPRGGRASPRRRCVASSTAGRRSRGGRTSWRWLVPLYAVWVPVVVVDLIAVDPPRWRPLAAGDPRAVPRRAGRADARARHRAGAHGPRHDRAPPAARRAGGARAPERPPGRAAAAPLAGAPPSPASSSAPCSWPAAATTPFGGLSWLARLTSTPSPAAWPSRRCR